MSISVKFTKTTHQIWSCQIFLFRLLLYLILGKVTKYGEIGSRTKKLQAKKQIGGGKHTPPPHPLNAYRVKSFFCTDINDNSCVFSVKILPLAETMLPKQTLVKT